MDLRAIYWKRMTNRTHRKQLLNINNVMRILFANIGWMEHYKGNCDADMIVGGGDYDDKDKHEAFNFQELNGACYGFVQTVRSSKINLCRIDNTIPKSATKIDKVLVVWVASRPDSNGSYIVGWYNNATVYADYQPSNNSARKYPYNITAQKDDCILLPIDSRTLNVPRAATTEKGFLGQSNVWYADYSSSAVQEFRDTTIDFITKYKTTQTPTFKYLIKVDTEARKMVEEAAVNYVTKEYQSRGYHITSREKDNIGWDLDAVCGKIHLKLEVKGLSSSTISVHITSNEFEKMEDNRKNYRLCIVINAVTNPQLIVFIWDNTLKQWVSEDDSSTVLIIDMKPSYIACVK